MYLGELCICSKILDFIRETCEILGTYSYESDASRELLISHWTLLVSFFHPSIRHSPVETLFLQLQFVPDRDKENSTAVLLFLRV
jgi:hypothetical protein